MKLWAGRFAKEVDAKTHELNASIAFDARMARQDIAGSIAHASMLGQTGIIAQADANAIVTGLKGILTDLETGALQIDMEAEDIHTFVEAELTRRIGDAGKRLHTGRSRNDQVALDLRLYLLEQVDGIKAQLDGLIGALIDQAEEYADAVMPGYTHLQRAQPITFGHHLLAYAEMFVRDIGRLSDCRRRMDVSPLGSGALAATTYPLDRMAVARSLGLAGVTHNSLDGVSDRDFAVELAADLALVMTHLSRFAEEMILWCSWEFRFVELDDAFATGSSIMPQKKNPDIAELARGKAGRVFGDLTTLLTALKGLPLAYNKDMQEDKEAIFDAVDTVALCLAAFTPMIETMRPLPDNMRGAAAAGFINATDCADYLVGKGMPFRDAYQICGSLVARCIAAGCTLETLPLAEYREASPLFEPDIYEAIALDASVARRNIYGGPAPEQVRAQVARLRALRGQHYNEFASPT